MLSYCFSLPDQFAWETRGSVTKKYRSVRDKEHKSISTGLEKFSIFEITLFLPDQYSGGSEESFTRICTSVRREELYSSTTGLRPFCQYSIYLP